MIYNFSIDNIQNADLKFSVTLKLHLFTPGVQGRPPGRHHLAEEKRQGAGKPGTVLKPGPPFKILFFSNNMLHKSDVYSREHMAPTVLK